MVNPAICRKCPHCRGVDLPVREGDVLVAEVMVHCGLTPVHAQSQSVLGRGGQESSAEEDLTVMSFVPENCQYRLEHLLLEEATAGLKEGWDDERTGK